MMVYIDYKAILSGQDYPKTRKSAAVENLRSAPSGDKRHGTLQDVVIWYA